MNLEPLTPADSTVILIDYAVGFADVLGSHDLATHINNVTGSFPRGMGYDFAGVVEAVGDGVTRLSVGDEVLGGRRSKRRAPSPRWSLPRRKGL